MKNFIIIILLLIVLCIGINVGSGSDKTKSEIIKDKIEIIKQALLKHPEGVLVRYAAFPHTMVAIGFTDDVIYFNDPAPTSSSSYSLSALSIPNNPQTLSIIAPAINKTS